MQIAALMPMTVDLGRRRERKGDRRASHSRTVSTTQRARRAGGPQDCALYICGCGFAFTAAVSTSVGCPHCGTAQAW